MNRIEKLEEIEASLPQLDIVPTRKNVLILSVIYQMVDDVKRELIKEEGQENGRAKADPG